MRLRSQQRLTGSMVSTLDRRGLVMREAAGPAIVGGRAEDAGWNAISSASLGRDLPQTLYDKHIRLSFAQYRQNPMAKRLINMPVSFIVGTGVNIVSEDEKVLAVLREFWNDKHNDWPNKLIPRLTDLLLYGEWALVPMVSDAGRVRLRGIQPDAIKAVFPDPMAHDTPDKVILKKVVKDGIEVQDYPLDIVRWRIDTETGEVDDAPSGDIFHFGLNRTSDSMRGVGELFPLIDYIDVHDQMIYDRAEAIAAQSAVWFDLTLEGMNTEQINKYLSEETELPPRPGTLWAHNEKASMEARSPKLEGTGHAEDVGVVHSAIISGAGWPGTFFDDPGSAGRAVGAEMAEPAFKNIIMLQNQIRGFFTTMLNYVLWHAKAAGRIDSYDEESFYISFGRPSARDIQRIGPAMARLYDFVNKAWNDNIITREQAGNIVVTQLNQLGLTDAPLRVEVGEDPREIKKREAEEAFERQQQLAAQSAQAVNPAASGGGAPNANARRQSQPVPASERANGR